MLVYLVRVGKLKEVSRDVKNVEPVSQEEQREAIRELERSRLRALVAADMQQAERLHADDLQLINPRGATATRAEYLGGIASGAIDYRLWEPEAIAVRLHGEMAVVRYQAQMEIVRGGRGIPMRLWHTDVYERRDGQWQVVWSQATRIEQQADSG